MISFASELYQYGVCFVMASNEIDSFANELSIAQLKHSPLHKTREIQFSRRKMDTLKRKKKTTLGLELWDSNSENFHVDLSTKLVVVLLVMSLSI